MAALPACAPKVYDDPVPVMLNTETGVPERLEAAEQARQKMPDDPRRIKALNAWLWQWGQPGELRRYAIDELVRRDETAFRNELAERIVQVRNPDTLTYLYQLGSDRHWPPPEFTAIVVRRYAVKEYGKPDLERPEKDVLLKLNPGKSLEQIVFDVFANPQGQLTLHQQISAWELLGRLTDRPQLETLLASAPQPTLLVTALRRANTDWHVLPVNEKGVQTLLFLTEPGHEALWQAYQQRVAVLSAEQRRGLELRHLPVLLWLDEKALAMDRAQLLADVSAQVDAGRHYVLSRGNEGGDPNHPQMLFEWAKHLSWGDLATIHLLQGVLRDRKVVNDLFAQGDADVQDESTEYGGVLDKVAEPKTSATHWTVQGYPAASRGNNIRYFPPPAMIVHLFTAVAHYHFHAQDYHNSANAGPGGGDLDNADSWNLNFLVFSFVDHDHLNVDYYQEGRVVIDLGTLQRW